MIATHHDHKTTRHLDPDEELIAEVAKELVEDRHELALTFDLDEVRHTRREAFAERDRRLGA